MTLVQRYGKPDIFLTMTCNPNWKEITNELHLHEEKELKDQLFKRKIFDQVSAYVYKDWQVYAPESFDEIVSTEIPDKNTNLHLHNAVVKHMMHGPCGVLNPSNVCMKKKGCYKSNYPKNYASTTTVGNDYFPIYRCSNNGVTVKVRGQNLDNRWVVPYNLYLLTTFDCHINVEICSTIKAVKYLYKYIYKGHDRRIYGFTINEMYPAVYSLHLHLEDQHPVTFRANDDLINVVNLDRSRKSMLTEFFALNRKKKIVIGRIVTANPFEGKRYYLRILLNHVRGPLLFDDLKIVDGAVIPTFREAATMHDLRRLFATILVYCNPTNPRELWERFEQDMSDDFKSTEDSISNVRTQVLKSISFTIESMGKDINSYHLLDDDICFDEEEFQSREIDDELAVEIPEEDIAASQSLNSEQRHVYNVVLEKVFANQNATFFIDGPGGTGKTFLYRALLATVRSRKLVALATASSGVAAPILPGGRTAHSRFKLPLDIDERNTCCVSKQSALANLLHAAKLIIWDEAPMTRKKHIEALDKMLRDINDLDVTFGAKVVVFGGNFRQVLPVNSSSVYSYLWPTLTKFRLTENMRARFDPVFSDYVLEVGNGMPPNTVDETIKISNRMLIPSYDDNTSLDHLIEDNSYVDEMNALLIHRLLGEIQRYYSFDEIIDASEQSVMEDFLNTLTPNGLPPHELLLKKNCHIMLLRNINLSEWLCNGTRLICRPFDQNVIDAEIAVGHHIGKRVFIPRIPFLPNVEENSDFPFKRTQFPIRLSFAMTINKSQGQTLDCVGIYLSQPVFSHGQLYVALSRAKTSSAVRILIRPVSTEQREKNCTKNIVFTELLTLSCLN
ncbi:hypothetical protein I3842_02G107600 [Carya illinoinensis]|uniref:ATP-dependent DNA helicase n=1 Tax=Carya illinoinensis TaxID=32201 RepID=A0A922K0K7_CARIL|nr:hypothetical protein I3842_02G107600 [Carya illinoinensis]